MWYAMVATTLAGLATALGGVLGALYRPGRRGMAFAMGFGAGVMLSISLMDMLPAALGRYLAAFSPLRAGAMAASLVLIGLAAGALLEKLLPEEKAFAGGGEEGRVLRSALVTALALVGHNLPEGVMTLFASLEDPAVGARLAVAIGLHNLPEGLAVALPVLYATKSRGRAFLAALASGLAEPAGALLAWGLLGGRITAGVVTGMAALVSGVMCWVSAAELLPTALSLGKKETAAAGFGAGLLAMTLGIALLS